MVWIPGGEFSMGAADPQGIDRNDLGMHATADSRPVHRVYVDGFWMDKTEVTNAQFAAFVNATGYVSVAERAPRATAVRRAAYGPYAAARSSAWYNPATGRYGRSASVQTPFGGRSTASFYNLWTGSYARTNQGHNAYAQW
jgi:formylglycine-generating enzyme required for sulfatase activity